MAHIFEYVRGLWQESIEFLRRYNIFPSSSPSTDESDLRNQRISTRLFIILLILSISILIVYSSLVNITKINDVNEPDLTEYLYLYSKYRETLTCPCTKISIKYKIFLRINYTLHQVCNSIFVTDDWITYLGLQTNEQISYIDDFRTVDTYIFQTLKVFCESSDRTISDSLSRFYLNEYAALTVTSEELFQSESQTLMRQFILSTLNNFLSSLQIIHGTTYANNLFTALQNQYYFAKESETQKIIRHLINFEDCRCSSEKCIVPTEIFDFPNETSLFTVPGL